MTLLACQCAHSLLSDLDDYIVEGTGCKLRLHIGIGAGPISGIHVGGMSNQVEFFISGGVLEQVSTCEKQASPGEAYISAYAFSLVENERISGTKSKAPGGNVRLDSINFPADLPSQSELPLFQDMEDSFKMYIQAAVLRHIGSGTKQWLAELRRVSVIFVNLSTPFRDEQLPLLQETIAAMQRITYKYEGTVRQFMIDDKGSVFIAGFGLPPLSHQDDAVRAVDTALEIHSTLLKMNVPCSIGVTTGQAFCGDVGSARRREYAMVGDIVNLSARLMAAAQSGILIDEATKDGGKLAPHLRFTKKDEIRVKGKSNLIPVFIPSRVSRSIDQGSRSFSVLDPIVGRRTEKDIIRKAIERLEGEGKKHKTRILCIEGDAGVGKSKLVDHTVLSFQELSRPTFYGSANEMENSKSYHAWHEIFAKALGKGGLTDKIKDKLGHELLPLLNVIIPTGLEDTDNIRAMSGQSRSESTLILLTKLLRLIIPKYSLIVLENAHWLDSASWGLALAAATQMSGILLMIALRPLSSPLPFQYSQIIHHKYANLIQLKGLAEEETSQLIASMLLVDKVPSEMSKEVHLKGQGNPFLTIELIGALRDNKALTITKTGECIMKGDITQCLSSVPSSLTGLITSKVDRLKPSQQIVLKVASVIGQSFTVPMLLQALPEEADRSQLPEDLIVLVNTNLIVSDTQTQQGYAFTNTLIREAVYGLMLFAQRRVLHKRISMIYQKDFPGDNAYYPLIGHHLKHAEEYDEALSYFLKSGSNSLFHYANQEAITFFTEAINLCAKLTHNDTLEAIGIERKLGQAYYNLGQVNKADEHFRKALEIMEVLIPTVSSKIKNPAKVKINASKESIYSPSENSHRRREALICLLALAKLNLFSCDKAIATYCANYALKIAEDVGEALMLEIYAILTLTAGINGDPTLAESFIEKAKVLDLGRKQFDVIMTVDQFIGMYYSGLSRWDEAEEKFQSSIEAAKTVGSLRNVEESMIFLGTCYYHRGELQKAISVTAEAVASAVTRGDPSTQILGLNAQARNLYALGEYNKSLKCLADVNVALESGSGDVTFAQISYCGLMSLVQFRRGKIQECWDLFDAGMEKVLGKEPSFYFTYFGYACFVEVSILHYQETKMELKSSNKQKVLPKAEKALGCFEKFAKIFNFAQPRYSLWKGALNFLNGKPSKAEAEWAKCVELCQSLGLKHEYAFIMFRKGMFTGRAEDTLAATKAFPSIVSLVKNLCDTSSSKKELDHQVNQS